MHGFGVHLCVCYQYWEEEDIVGLGCVCLQKMVVSTSCDLSDGIDDFLGNL